MHAMEGSNQPVPDAHYDRHREREFYRYYDPIRALSTNDAPFTDLYDPQAAHKHRPASSPDCALTAFCQLGALRLNTRRCMLFFFDVSNAYVVAEATKTLSLQDDNVYNDGDGLWLGHTVIPRGLSICEHTVNVKSRDGKADPNNNDGTGILHIINDLTGHTTFCDRPYVTDGPKARFYAGVPLTTPLGLRIGAFCALDDKPRDGLSQSEQEFLLQMSKTIMAHLETVRERAEYGRGKRMLSGLHKFVQESQAGRVHRDPARKASEDLDAFLRERPAGLNGHTVASDPTPPPVTNGEVDLGSGSQILNVPAGQKSSLRASNAHRPRQIDQDILSAAAPIIRDAVDADGCLLLGTLIRKDVVSGNSDRASRRRPRSRSQSNPEDTADQSLTGEDSDAFQSKTAPTDHTSSPVLGSSIRVTERPRHSSIQFPDALLRRLLRRYPRGKIWNFSVDGETGGSSDEVSSPQTPNLSSGTQDSPPHRPSHFERRQTKWITQRAKDATELRRLLPKAQSICLAGMWDRVRQSWCAAVIFWSCSPIRVFTASAELSYVSAFGEVVMAEMASTEAKEEVSRRSGFVESVSHEFRSPLHGILGSIDMLREEHPELKESSNVVQVETCALNMLDLVEHLLSFAEEQRPGAKNAISNEDWSPRGSSLKDPFSSDSSASSMARATEDVLSGVYHTHTIQNGPSDGPEDVELVLDIDINEDIGLQYGIGVWKRVCGTVMGNALKFTKQGYIEVNLTTVRKRKRALAVLRVTDTGCGMSSQFLNDGLFTDFGQEDSLTTGMGLGMSLTNRLVRQIGGSITVDSIQRKGTTFTITVPIKTPSSSESPVLPLLQDVKLHLIRPAGLDVDMDSRSSGRKRIVASLEKTVKLMGAELVGPSQASVVAAFEENIGLVPSGVPLLVLCHDTRAMQRLKESQQYLDRAHLTHCISQPYGRSHLLLAIRRCLELEVIMTNSRMPSCGLVPVQELDGAMSSFETESHMEKMQKLSLAHKTLPSDDGYGSPPTDSSMPTRPAPVHHKSSNTSEGVKSDVAEPDVMPTLLLVDDNPINLKLLVTYANKKKHPFLSAVNGEEALNMYKAAALGWLEKTSTSGLTERTRKPDVIFLDINMPVMDGFEAARQIRTFESEQGILPATIIAVTGLGSVDARQTAVASGIDMFLTKPVRLKEMSYLLSIVKPPSSVL